MAVNETRNMGADLREGITDGIVKKLAPDRGGVVEFDAHLSSTLQEQYDMIAAESVNSAHKVRLA